MRNQKSMKLVKLLILFVLFGIGFTFYACVSGDKSQGSSEVISKKAGVNEVSVHELGDPDKVHPILSTSAGSTYIEGNIFGRPL